MAEFKVLRTAGIGPVELSQSDPSDSWYFS
jgi:hypothetical protein